METLREELLIRMDGRPQNLMAKRMGISQTYLSDIMCGKVDLNMGKAVQGILRLWPDMWPFFMPEDIAIRIAKDVQSRNGNGQDCGEA